MKKLIEWFKQWFSKEVTVKEIIVEKPLSNCLTCFNLSLILKMKTLNKVHACKYHGYVTEPAITLCSDYEKSHK